MLPVNVAPSRHRAAAAEREPSHLTRSILTDRVRRGPLGIPTGPRVPSPVHIHNSASGTPSLVSDVRVNARLPGASEPCGALEWPGTGGSRLRSTRVRHRPSIDGSRHARSSIRAARPACTAPGRAGCLRIAGGDRVKPVVADARGVDAGTCDEFIHGVDRR